MNGSIKKICNATNLKYLAVAIYKFWTKSIRCLVYGGTYMVDDAGTSVFPNFPLSCC